jgi:DNA-binding transcriptional LysR family regulator
MNLKALQSLLAIHDAQSFQEAARRLGVTQSAVSMQIKTLENDLGVELFDRSVRPPSMTNAAVAIIKPAREIIALAQSIRESLHDQSTLAGHLSLGAVSTSTLSFLPDGLIAVRRRYPGITIKVETGLSGVLLDHVKSGSLDAAIITEPKEIPPGLRCEVLVRESLALVCSIESNKEPLALNDVMKMPFIRFNRRAGVGQIIEAFLAKKGLHPDESMELDSLEAIVGMVERGLGISIVPTGVVEKFRQRVAITELTDIDAVRRVSFVFRDQNRKAALFEPLLSALRESARPSYHKVI